ncbi:uncharacterized protein [Rutidosis leptorrhynchoides]|uniref:uncharacterized protein n=1 Tax=Rutidosis leptorrhynchoides TaxID=125765 RepID=UPI003A994EA2
MAEGNVVRRKIMEKFRVDFIREIAFGFSKNVDDQGESHVPYELEDKKIYNELADMRASVNVMPYSMFKRIEIGRVMPTTNGVRLYDYFVKRTMGIVRNMVVRFWKLAFLVDFYMVDVKEDEHTPLVFGRTFINISNAFINVRKRFMTFSIKEKILAFRTRNPPTCKESSSMVDEKLFVIGYEKEKNVEGKKKARIPDVDKVIE